MLKCKVIRKIYVRNYVIRYYVIRNFLHFVLKRKSEIYNLNLNVQKICIVRYTVLLVKLYC